MSIQYTVAWQAKFPFRAIDGRDYCIWHYQITSSGVMEELPAKLGLAFSRNIDILDPIVYPDVEVIQGTSLDQQSSVSAQYVLATIQPSVDVPLQISFVAPCAEDSFATLQLVAPGEAPNTWTPLQFRIAMNGSDSITQTILGPAAASLPFKPTGNMTLENAARHIEKATLVPLRVEQPVNDPGYGGAIQKNGFVRQLALRDGEVDAIRQHLAETGAIDLRDIPWHILKQFEQPTIPSILPTSSVFTKVPTSSLVAVAAAITHVRQDALNRAQRILSEPGAVQGQAMLSNDLSSQVELAHSLHLATTVHKAMELFANALVQPIGMLNLERLEMAPAGVERGELLATIPLAPLEETAVTHKEWSVTSKEFTSIVVDSLENVSETGVTDNTELAQSTTSQNQHTKQFNITGTVSGGIPIITGSTTTSLGAQDSDSQSATDSRKHAVNITQKASSRSKQEHKVTISTKTETGTSETTTRMLKNPSPTDPIRIDYFSLMRKWQVSLYRYGLRLTYDIVIPEPAGAMRETYAELQKLRDRIKPFEFLKKPSDITKEQYLALADEYKVNVPNYPDSHAPLQRQIIFNPNEGWTFAELAFDVPDGYVIENVWLHAHIPQRPKVLIDFSVMGANELSIHNNVVGNLEIPNDGPLIDWNGNNFLQGSDGHQSITFFTDKTSHLDPAWIGITVNLAISEQKISQWRNEVWNALYNAAQLHYLSEQQDIQGKIAQLEYQLSNVDTLTLRREESDEIMKGILRFLLGPGFEFMPDAVLKLIGKTGNNDDVMKYGVGFTGNKLPMGQGDFALVRQYEDVIRFLNQAIEWENVVTFLYSYFWDVPPAWPFIRQIRHPDSTRQAFLRAGSARVVLTIRKGWEQAWVRFHDTGDPYGETTSPYLSIAKEIAAYDDRNYPGIPPANPGKSAVRLEDAIYTSSASRVGPSEEPIVIEVASSTGIVSGLPVVIDSYVYPNPAQESQLVVEVLNSTQIKVKRLNNAHGENGIFPVVQPGNKGILIAQWNEYTPNSGVDIAVSSNLATVN